jgi:hypothetical protein
LNLYAGSARRGGLRGDSNEKIPVRRGRATNQIVGAGADEDSESWILSLHRSAKNEQVPGEDA